MHGIECRRRRNRKKRPASCNARAIARRTGDKHATEGNANNVWGVIEKRNVRVIGSRASVLAINRNMPLHVIEPAASHSTRVCVHVENLYLFSVEE